jgi:hypothetical protein
MNGWIITGGGRTGSHWVAGVLVNTLKAIQRYYTIEPINKLFIDEIPSMINDRIVHTNDPSEFDLLPEETLKNCQVIVTRRRNLWSRAISLVVAKHTDEWTHYDTSRIIEPFHVNSRQFYSAIHESNIWDVEIQKLVDRVSRVHTIWYEDMVENSSNIEQWMADQLDIKNMYNVSSIEPVVVADYSKTCNPRNYQNLIINWEELKNVYQVWVESNQS